MELYLAGDDEYWDMETGTNGFTPWSMTIVYDTSKVQFEPGDNWYAGKDAVLSLSITANIFGQPLYQRTYGAGQVWLSAARMIGGGYESIDIGTPDFTAERLGCAVTPLDPRAAFSQDCYTIGEIYIPGAAGPHTHQHSQRLISEVPEPAIWALMIGGFGMAGATLRRRRAAEV
ncbi:MAG: hypothetical protein DI570_09990 [Phenylobacterium zucineum]|nr:MAG: hypothetical protein DI570_09990 [Phenylobacterium zucineum]